MRLKEAKVLFVTVFFTLVPVALIFAQSFNIATYNVFYYTPEEHPNSWEMRKSHVASIIKFHDIVLWGSQEGEYNQLQYLSAELGQHYVGFARDDGDKEGEHSAIFYDPTLFRLLEDDTFWLSETPERPSMDWGVNFHRICTWAKFEHLESGELFYVYNVHFDHESQLARENSSKMVLEHMNKNTEPGDHIIFLGDLNAVPGNRSYELFVEDGRFRDAYDISELPPHGPEGTFNGFSFERVPDRRIDHIFVTDQFNVRRLGILTDSYANLRYPSDHFPVLAEIEFVH